MMNRKSQRAVAYENAQTLEACLFDMEDVAERRRVIFAPQSLVQMTFFVRRLVSSCVAVAR
jgi:hypothetical protein